ncbi:MAG: hypothetical protein RL693_2307 [Verrucomicrobiota bacterium]|jgi:hypothetical protein
MEHFLIFATLLHQRTVTPNLVKRSQTLKDRATVLTKG